MKFTYIHRLFFFCLIAPTCLLAQQGTAEFDAIATSAMSKQVKRKNIILDTVNKRVVIPVIPGTKLAKFDPGFIAPNGVTITSVTNDFSGGPVKYSITIPEKGTQSYAVEAKVYHNPVLNGLFADPDIIYAEKTRRFYIYPTSDGYTNWLGTNFRAFSSRDLVTWRDEGVILDLKVDVSWAENRAWAPSVIERKINGKYKYFYYFCAEQKIGVATSDDPAGPFRDSGKPLLENRPEVILRRGQTIDPAVFKDPGTGKYYLYWGNGFMAGAELNDDMVTIKTESIKELTPKNYTEGTHVFYRNGLYYFMWSQNDTRDPNYRVRYGTASSPLGDINTPKDNLILLRDDRKGIFGTGHNSTIQVPGKDQWYIVYHRFTYPNGIAMGREAGYNREVCIDKMEFDSNGSIRVVVPTHEGIKPVSVK